MKFSLTLGVILGLCILILAFQNPGGVQVRFIIWTFKTSEGLLILSSAIVGLALGGLIRLRGK
ncbi:LapA family protein [bacterium]|nr:LapA family protein [bacterium]